VADQLPHAGEFPGKHVVHVPSFHVPVIHLVFLVRWCSACPNAWVLAFILSVILLVIALVLKVFVISSLSRPLSCSQYGKQGPLECPARAVGWCEHRAADGAYPRPAVHLRS
jgi:hypothetical protein